MISKALQKTDFAFKLSSNDYRGVIIGSSIIILWLLHLLFLLSKPINFSHWSTYLHILVQTHLYTGLFITAHDSMHGCVSRNTRINKTIGFVSATLFSFNFYNKLFKKHHLHHKHVATDKDPDFSEKGFFLWYFKFIIQYLSIWQIILMAITYNILKLFFSDINLIIYWMIPAILSTLQLFYFGTYLPHRKKPNNEHFARSPKKNHLLAFLSCYFFGYHYEHHAFPATPWWLLYKVKETHPESITHERGF